MLSVILDLNTLSWPDKETLQGSMDKILMFMHIYLSLDPTNTLSVVACDYRHCKVLYPTKEAIDFKRKPANTFHEFYKLDYCLRKGILDFVSGQSGECASSKYAAALSLALANMKKTKSSIIIVSCSKDDPKDYVSLMNAFFAAQKQDCKIHLAQFEPSVLLAQGCEITGGHLCNVTQDNFLSKMTDLLLDFIPNAEITRSNRSICFCHKKVVEIGHVCSVCLSSRFLFNSSTLRTVVTMSRM